MPQYSYFCTGSHRWDKETFDLVTKPIVVEDQCWVAAMVRLAPGVIVRSNTVLGMGVQAAGEHEPNSVYLADNAELRKQPRLNT